jgi:hypothetical protein
MFISVFLSFLRLPQFTLFYVFYFILLFPCLNNKCDEIINSLNAFLYHKNFE